MRISGCTLSKERMQVVQQTLAQSNILLNEYHKKITSRKGRKGHRTHQGKKLTKAKYLSEIFCEYNKNPHADVCLHGLVLPNSDVCKIIQTKQLESEVIESLVGLVCSIVSKKQKLAKDLILSKEDLESECFGVILENLCKYMNSTNCLSTYIYKCMCRRIYNLCNKTNSLSKLSAKSIDLKRKYLETKNSLLRSSNFEEIVEIMKISQKEIGILQSTLVAKTTHFSETDKIENYEIKNTQEKNNTKLESLNLVDFELIELSDLEKAVLEGYVQSKSKKGISSISKNLINPKTGKPYTRMAASIAWKRVQKKLQILKGAA
jgi:hypothetical protein